MDILSYYYW